MIAELEALAQGEDKDFFVRREVRLTRHPESGRFHCYSVGCRGVLMGCGAIEGTVRRVINLRMMGNGI